MHADTQPPARGRPPADDDARPRRWRRLAWIGLLILAGLVLLAAFAPTLLSTGPARTRLFGYASKYLGTTVDADDLSLSWLGNQEVKGLLIENAEGEPAARLGQLTLKRGLLSLAWDPGRLGAIVIDGGEIWPEELAQLQPPEPKRPPAPAPAAPARPRAVPMPDSVQVHDLTVHSSKGAVRITQADFQNLGDRCSGHCDLAVEHAGERGTASFDVSVTGLTEAAASPGALAVTATGRYDQLSLAPIWEILSAAGVPFTGSGTVSGTFDVSRSSAGDLAARLTCDGKDVWVTGDALGGDRPEFDTLHLEADGTYEGRLLKVKQFVLRSPLATADASGTFDLSAGATGLAPGSGRATLEVALAPLARMLPHTLNLHKDVRVESGQLKATLALKSEGTTTDLGLGAEVTDLRGDRSGRAIALAPVHLAADLERTDTEVRAKDFSLTGPFGSIEGRGRLEEFSLVADLNLKEAVDQIGQFVDLGPYRAAGTAQFELATAGTFERGIHLSARTRRASGLLALGPNRQWEEPDAALTGEANLTFDREKRLTGLAVEALKVQSAAGDLEASGTADLKDGKWSFKGQTSGGGDLGRLVQLIQVCLDKSGSSASGTWHVDASAEGTIGQTVSAVVKGRAADVKLSQAPGGAASPVSQSFEKADVLADVRYDHGPSDHVAVRELRVDIPGLKLKGSGNLALPAGREELPGAAAPGPPPSAMSQVLAADGKADASMDLAVLAGILRLLGAMPDGLAVSGSADLAVAASPSKDGRKPVQATVSARDLDLGWNDGRRVRQGRLEASADAAVGLDEGGAVRSIEISAWSLDAPLGKLAGDASLRRQRDAWTWRVSYGGGGAVGPLAETVAGLLASPPAPIQGQWKASGQVDTGAAAGTVFSLTADASDLAIAQPRGAASELARLPDTRIQASATLARNDTLQVHKMNLTGPGVTLEASGTVRLPSESPHQSAAADGSVSFDGDLAELAKVLRPFGVLAPESSMAGRAALAGKAASTRTGFSGAGTLAVADLSLRLAGPDLALQEKTVYVPIAFSVATQEDLWKVTIKGMRSGIASGDLDGSLALAEPASALDARCDLVCDGEKVRAVLGSRLPTELHLEKIWRVVARASGPLRSAGAWNARIAGLTGEADMDTGAFDYRGLAGRQGKVRLRLAGGTLAILRDAPDPSRLTVNEGTIALGGQADLTRTPAPYVLSERLLVVDRVRLNDQVTREFLKFTSPVLALSVKPGGLLSVSLDEARIPLGEGITEHSDLRGHLWVQNFQAELSGPLGALVEWAGGKTLTPIQDLGPFELDLHEGTFYIRNQRVKFSGETALELNGTIGLDGRLEVTVSMPLTAALLKRFHVPEKAMLLLANQRIPVPLRGTVDHPKLDEKALAAEIAKIGLEALRREAIDDVGKWLEGVLKKKLEKKSGP